MSNGKKVEQTYGEGLLRFVASTAYSLTSLVAAQQLFGRGYLSLSQTEKRAVDEAVFGMIVGNYSFLTREYFAGTRPPNKAGFQPGQPPAPPPEEPSKEGES